MTDKKLLTLGIATVGVPVLGFALVTAFGSFFDRSEKASASAAVVADSARSIVEDSSEPARVQEDTPVDVGPVMDSSKPILDNDLETLAVMVDLTDSSTQEYKPEKWAKAMPIAQNLLKGAADCAQRNWLTQFVAVGNEAISGTPTYQEHAQMLATMYRNNTELVTGIPTNE